MSEHKCSRCQRNTTLLGARLDILGTPWAGVACSAGHYEYKPITRQEWEEFQKRRLSR